jgi:hypothetical protein
MHPLPAIEIDASPEATWAVVADLGGFAAWNPFLVSGSGEPRSGARIELTMRPGSRTMSFSPTVLDVDPGRRIRWIGRLLVPGAFDGEHELAIEPLDRGRSRFTQPERFSGVLVPLFGGLLRDTDAGFAAMNEALKRRVEAGPASGDRPT